MLIEPVVHKLVLRLPPSTPIEGERFGGVKWRRTILRPNQEGEQDEHRQAACSAYVPQSTARRLPQRKSGTSGALAGCRRRRAPVAAARQSRQRSAPAQQGPALVQPVELCPNNGVLSVSFKVEMQAAPVYDPTTNTFTALPVRTYNLDQTGTWRFCGGQGSIQNPMIPGPTIRLRKGTPGNTDGTQFSLMLTNRLPVDGSNHTCNPVINYSATVPARPDGTCNLADFPSLTTEWPACFHGDNVTNMHFHGFHISPQPPQDFVLLSLYPEGTPHVTPSPQSRSARTSLHSTRSPTPRPREPTGTTPTNMALRHYR